MGTYVEMLGRMKPIGMCWHHVKAHAGKPQITQLACAFLEIVDSVEILKIICHSPFCVAYR